MEASKLMKVKKLKEENSKLKHIYAELSLVLNMTKHVKEKAIKLYIKRKLVQELIELYP